MGNAHGCLCASAVHFRLPPQVNGLCLLSMRVNVKASPLLCLRTEVLPIIGQLWHISSAQLLSLRGDVTGCKEIREVAHVYTCINVVMQLSSTSRSCYL